jgi:hypothetical protein
MQATINELHLQLKLLKTIQGAVNLMPCPHYATVCQLARPGGIVRTGVDVFIGLYQLAKSCQVACQLEPD